jgi:hypothetical protein
METKFSPDGTRSSMEGWIGNFPSVEAVQAADNRELEEIAGSYEAIADRMQTMWGFAYKFVKQNRDIVPDGKWDAAINPVLNRFMEQYGENFGKDDEAWRAYIEEWSRLRASFPETHLDEKVAVLQSLGTRGFQLCPFKPCEAVWNEEVQVYGRKNGRQLTINRGTIHLAREHHFLEKGNEYGISPREFYEAFM